MIKDEVSVRIGDQSFISLPKVFSPVCSSDTQWFAGKITPLVKNFSFLEIGTGTGIIACLACMSGASKVVATDINPRAIKNALINQKLLKLKFSIRLGSVFDPIDKNEFFDLIFWNHPFNYTDDIKIKDDMLNLSVFDVKYESLKSFFYFGKRHLTANGKLLLGTSNIANLQMIKKMAKTEGYNITLLDRSNVSAYKNRKTEMDLRLYSFEAI
jgi:methylase of polypeptide subunit release factors